MFLGAGSVGSSGCSWQPPNHGLPFTSMWFTHAASHGGPGAPEFVEIRPVTPPGGFSLGRQLLLRPKQ